VRISIREVVQDAGRGDGAGVPGDVPVPAELRATLIPAIAVPVVLLGTFGVLAAASAIRSTR
jgi:HAE1 family hydrophobic/amphiphilic exporter-1